LYSTEGARAVPSKGLAMMSASQQVHDQRRPTSLVAAKQQDAQKTLTTKSAKEGVN